MLSQVQILDSGMQSVDTLYRATIANLGHKSKEVYIPAAEAIAAAFKSGQLDFNPREDGGMAQHVLQTVMRLKSAKPNGTERFVGVVYKVAAGGLQ